jgi:ribosomal protein S18 acetylase RimI-like enzyme
MRAAASAVCAVHCQAALQVGLHERRVLCSTLHVDASNTPAIALYTKAGFEKDGVITDYYGPGKPALKLLADLREATDVAAFVAGGI